MSLPSMTDASESMKKLQCAWSRPSSSSDSLPVVSRNFRNASHRWPTLLPHQAHRVVLAQEPRLRIGRVLPERVHHHEAAQAARRSRTRGVVEDVDADAADLVRHRRLERERVFGHGHVGPDDQLIVAVRMVW